MIDLSKQKDSTNFWPELPSISLLCPTSPFSDWSQVQVRCQTKTPDGSHHWRAHVKEPHSMVRVVQAGVQKGCCHSLRGLAPCQPGGPPLEETGGRWQQLRCLRRRRLLHATYRLHLGTEVRRAEHVREHVRRRDATEVTSFAGDHWFIFAH